VSDTVLNTKPGYLTTEFWLTIAALAAGVVLVVVGSEDMGKWIISTAIPGYAISRGVAKK